MELEYEIALRETGLTTKQLPAKLNQQINAFKMLKLRADKNPESEALQIECHAKDSVVADMITDFYENDFENNESDNDNMSKENEALKARAIACGLPETASEAQVAAKENEKTNAAAKAKADHDAAAADKVKADKDAADKAAADKAAADKAKVEEDEDVLDDLDL